MNKNIIFIALLVLIIFTFTGCTMQVVDLTYNFNYAYVLLPTGEVVEGKVDSWKDYEDSDNIQVKIDGVSYYSHGSNIILVSR